MAGLDSITGERADRVLPFYICLDVSYSMEGEKIAAARTILPALTDTLTMNPVIGDVVRVALIQFSDEARVIVPLGDPRDLTFVEELEIESGTSFGQLFSVLRSLIPADFDHLKSDGYAVHRPIVFILTDGEPTDDWKPEHHRLTDFDARTGLGFRMYPIIVPFGVQGSDIHTLREMASPRGRTKVYLATEVSPEDSIRELAQVMIQSVVASAIASRSGDQSGFVLPSVDDVGPAVHVDEDWI